MPAFGADETSSFKENETNCQLYDLRKNGNILYTSPPDPLS